MCARLLLGITIGVYFCGAANAAALSTDQAKTSFGRAVFSALSDPDARIRSYGWQAIGQLGRLSGANQLHTLKFEQFILQDRDAAIAHIDNLFDRAAVATDDGSTKTELAEFRQLSLSVPEVAALALGRPKLGKVFDSETLRQFREAAQRQRPQLMITPSGDSAIATSLDALESSNANETEMRRDGSATLARSTLQPSLLDRIEILLNNNSFRPEARRNLALAMIRNGRSAKTLLVVDDLLAAGVNSAEQNGFALDILTTMLLVAPSQGRQATIDRANQIIPLLSDTELFVKASAVLSQIARDDFAKIISLQLMRRIEIGDGLGGNLCVYSQALPRSRDLPLELALVSRIPSEGANRIDTAGCVIILGEDSNLTSSLRELALKIEPAEKEERQRRLKALDALWNEASNLDGRQFPNIVEAARKLLILDAASLASDFPLTSTTSLSNWMERAETARIPTQLYRSYLLRKALIWLPTVVGGILLWPIALILIVLTSRSETIRVFLLFHPLGRQIGALGQTNTLIFSIPILRRLFFLPYRTIMLGQLAQDIASESPENNYYSSSGVAELERGAIAHQLRELDRSTLSVAPPERPTVVEKLSQWEGLLFLIGQSGRGKSMFVRYQMSITGQARDPEIFATAIELGREPAKAIQARFGSAVPDDRLIDSLIQSKRLTLYIDGLNEVDPDTRASILDYMAARPHSNILVTTQPLDRYPSGAKLLALLPLTRSQIVSFLSSRARDKTEDSEISGYRTQSLAFVAEKLAEADGEFEVGDTDGRERSRALVERLSNPMDLQTIADLLLLGQRPDVWALQKQRHRLVDDLFREQGGGDPFPLRAFSRSVYEARRDGTSEIDGDHFPRVAEVLLKEKQIQRYVTVASGFKSDGYIFRHDKIRDFYTCATFVADPELRTMHAGDDKFAGVYDLLCQELPPREATELREYLAERALDNGDHRMSDRYLEGLRTRRALDSKDPPWLAEFDRDDVAGENDVVARREAVRAQAVASMAESLARLDAGRTGTRVISAPRSDLLLEATTSLLSEAGVVPAGVGSAQKLLFVTPSQFKFGVLGLAHYGDLPTSMLEGARALLGLIPADSVPTMVVVNAQADLEPSKRSEASLSAIRVIFEDQLVPVITACDLLSLVRSEQKGVRYDLAGLWS
ncbi:hypothetical protein [Bradyrhizobium sp. CCBAU 53338]|uniref:hypothetical protein n=1 Tax=Bradyrhizobium sp. CCBAU 53338 TaxID=1325111 RepID=UPI00188B3A19|nr:hypothetical protein [Bradyrhizobium sp. CCBAU 53338]QOZ55872.1 hypothetical protein XH90_34215 [Bradyrhizobium sp. CCBAU 53338]